MRKIILLAIIAVFLAACSKTTPLTGAVTNDGVYEIKTKIVQGEYSPNQLSVPAGSKVRFVVDATTAQGCMKSFTIPSMGIRTQLTPGENTFEFIAPDKGSVPFSCSMNMGRGVIRVA